METNLDAAQSPGYRQQRLVRPLLDVLLALHPTPDIYCPDCYMRRERCECKTMPKVADSRAWALVPNGGTAKKPILNVWCHRRSCKKVKVCDVIRPGDRAWYVAFAVKAEEVAAMGGIDSTKFRFWKERVMSNTAPMWHRVDWCDVGKRPRDRMTAEPIGRPHEDWEYIEPND